MRDGGVEKGAVGLGGGVRVDGEMDMVGPAGVVARHQGVEGRHSDVIGQLDAAEEGSVQVGEIGGRVSVALSGDTAVDTSGVGSYEIESDVWSSVKRLGRLGLTPDLQVESVNGLAGLDVEDLELEVDGNALLDLGDVAADVLASHVVWTDNALGLENARGFASKELLRGSIQRVVGGREVRGVENSADVQCGILAAWVSLVLSSLANTT